MQRSPLTTGLQGLSRPGVPRTGVINAIYPDIDVHQKTRTPIIPRKAVKSYGASSASQAQRP
jgi:hypothetical protein